ncbi:acyl carrier protein [Dickeya zeae]|nr:acyl carrier protein [Dickeya zeae]
MTHLREKIIETIKETAASRNAEIVSLQDDTVLLNSGLDSLGFAILVAKLEDELGYDPFVIMDTPVYPQTLREFIEIYQRFAPK